MQEREVPENRGKRARVTCLVEVELSDTRNAGDYSIAPETTCEFLAEETVTWVERKIPRIYTRTRGDGSWVQSILELFEDLGILPIGLGLYRKKKSH